MSEIAKPLIPSFSRAKRKVMDVIQTEHFEQLQSLFDQYDKDSITEFFLQEGVAILNWAVAYIADTSALSFFVNNIEQSTLKEIFQRNNFNILKRFLEAEAGKERFGGIENRQLRIKKFNLLLQIDVDGVSRFMEDYNGESYITLKIKEDFIKAKEQIKINVKSKLTLT